MVYYICPEIFSLKQVNLPETSPPPTAGATKPRILMVSVRGDHGGGPSHMYTLTKRMMSDFEIHVAIPCEQPYWDRFLLLIGESRLIAVPHRQFKFAALIRLVSEIRRRKIDIIHSHGKGAGLYGRLAAIISRRRSIHTFHGIHIGEYGAIKRVLYILLERTFSFVTDRIIATSMSELSRLKSLRLALPEKLVLIENGIDLPEQIEIPPNSDGKFHVVTITRFDFAKNPELLAEIIDTTLNGDQTGKIVFEIIGDGDGRAVTQNRLEEHKKLDRVVFHGHIDNPDEILSRSDCYLSTSRWEGLPLSILEAFAHSLPVVATNVRGNIDLVKHGETGLLYEIAEPNNAIEHLIKLRDGEFLCKRYGNAGRRLVEERFSAEQMCAKLTGIYEAILKH